MAELEHVNEGLFDLGLQVCFRPFRVNAMSFLRSQAHDFVSSDLRNEVDFSAVFYVPVFWRCRVHQILYLLIR